MKIPLMKLVARYSPRERNAIVVAVLLTAGVSGWALSETLTTSSVAVGDQSVFETLRKNTTNHMTQEPAHEHVKHGLIGSYRVTGTDSDGKPYTSAGIVDVALAPSGALELAWDNGKLGWDNGKQVGVGDVIGNVLVVASSINGRIAILVMNINPDGSLSGKWSRRTDRGAKGTETWKKT